MTIPSNASYLIEQMQLNENPTTDWWTPLSFTTYEMVDWPAVMWAGWYDIFLAGNLIAFDGYQKGSAPSVRGKSHLVIDPCGHCQDAAAYFPKHLIEGRVALPVLLAFDLFLNASPAESVAL